jgi:photosystem II stability/assembly factor-like uncharacterized protein
VQHEGGGMILISNGGSNIQRAAKGSDSMAVGTVDGVAVLARSGDGWVIKNRGLAGCFVSAVAALDDGTMFAATHGVGVAKSEDGGMTWTWCNDGLAHFDLWSARAGKLQGRDVVLVGSLPAHVYISENKGKTWRELTAFRQTPSVAKWYFPPPPRIGHVKDIVIDGDRLLVGVEVGALSVSSDFGETFKELPVEPDTAECDIHRILVHPDRPDRIIVANGLVGLVTSEDRGATWKRNVMPMKANYPDAIVLSPSDPDLIFMSAGTGWPSNWYVAGRARGKILRSRDGGKTWTRLLGGLPDGQRALFSAITIETSPSGTALHTADTDGQVFESLDEGETWSVIADVPPVSKGEFYRALVRERGKMANIDDIVVNAAAAQRIGGAIAGVR